MNAPLRKPLFEKVEPVRPGPVFSFPSVVKTAERLPAAELPQGNAAPPDAVSATPRVLMNASQRPRFEAQGGQPGFQSVDWRLRRMPASQLENALHRATQAWLDNLPEPLIPAELAARYPRIANRLARLWDYAPACHAYFDDLRIDWRIGRQGFPDSIAQELDALFGYYQRRCEADAAQGAAKRSKNEGTDVWSHEPDRPRATLTATTMLPRLNETTRFNR